MRKQKGILIVGVSICILLFVAAFLLLQPKDETGIGENKPEIGQNGVGESAGKDKIVTLEQAKEEFEADIKELMEGEYPNLIGKEFTASIEAAEGLFRFQILINQEDETTLENVGPMIEALESFFGDLLDKSQLYHRAYAIDENEEDKEFSYDELIEQLKEGDKSKYVFKLGLTLLGECYAHTDPAFGNTWFSKRSLGTSLPGGEWPMKEYLYVTGIRQEDTQIRLKDKTYYLSELEQNLLNYVNGEAFPLPHHAELSYQIGTTHVMDMGENDSINFVLRRVYQGVPFEYGSEGASGGYIDKLWHDFTTVNYVEGIHPDTMMGFFGLTNTVEVTEEISQMIPVREALRLLSEQIGENSIYEVRGVELVYRNREIPEDKSKEISNILEPKWKIITINKNDNKYTLFYVDVVTGEITDRFEYFYQ